MPLSNRITTTTNNRLLPKVVDLVLSDNVFAQMMMTKAAKWQGKQIEKVIKVSNGQSGSSFNGFDTFSRNASDTRQKMVHDAKFYQKSVAIAGTEIDINESSDEDKIIELIAIELESAVTEMADEIGTLFFGDGTGNSGKDFDGLQNIVDDGTNAATYGGLTRATYPTPLNATYTNSGGTISLAKLDTLLAACKSGNRKTTLGLTTEAIFDYIGQLFQPMERINMTQLVKGKGLEGQAGFTTLSYKGVPIVADEKCTTGVFYALNEKFLEWRAIKAKMAQPVKFKMNQLEGNNYSSVEGLGFSWTGWAKAQNAYAFAGDIIVGGQLWSSAPKAHGQLHSITGI